MQRTQILDIVSQTCLFSSLETQYVTMTIIKTIMKSPYRNSFESRREERRGDIEKRSSEQFLISELASSANKDANSGSLWYQNPASLLIQYTLAPSTLPNIALPVTCSPQPSSLLNLQGYLPPGDKVPAQT